MDSTAPSTTDFNNLAPNLSPNAQGRSEPVTLPGRAFEKTALHGISTAKPAEPVFEFWVQAVYSFL